MIITIKQSDKKHDVNKLHDAFRHAGIYPEKVFSDSEESTFIFTIGTPLSVIDPIRNSYQYVKPEPPPDLEKLKDVVRKAKTVAERKQALLELVAAEKGLPLGEQGDSLNELLAPLGMRLERDKEGLVLTISSPTSEGNVRDQARFRVKWEKKQDNIRRAQVVLDLADQTGWHEARVVSLP